MLAADAAAAAAPTVLDRIIGQVRAGLTGLLFAISKQTSDEGPPRVWLVLLAIAYDFVQVMQFPLSERLGWGSVANVSWLSIIFSFRNPFVIASVLSSALAPAVFGLLFVALLVFICCAIYAIHGFATGTFRSVRPVQILRATASLVVPLQVTIVERLATVFECGEEIEGLWSTTAISCNSTWLTLLRVMTVMLLAAFLAFSVVVTAVFLDRSYASPSPEARVLGRVEVVMVLMRAFLTLITATAGSGMPVSVLLVANMAFGLTWTYAYTRLLPDYKTWRNALLTALGCIFVWSAACAIPAYLLSESDPLRQSLGLIFLVGVPGSALAGIVSVRWRANAYVLAGAAVNGPTTIFRTPYDVELCARHMLQNAGVEAEAEERPRKRNLLGGSNRDPLGSSRRRIIPATAAPDASGAAAGVGDTLGLLAPMMSPHAAATFAALRPSTPIAVVAESTRLDEELYESDDEDEEEARSLAGIERDSVAETALRKAALLFQRGCRSQFPGSALMDLLHANWLQSFPRALRLVDYSEFLRETRLSTALLQPHALFAAEDGDTVAFSGPTSASASASAALFAVAAARSGSASLVTAEVVRLSLLESGIAKQPSLDVQFLLVQAKQNLEEELETALADLQHKRVPKRLGVVETLMLERLLGQLGGATLRAQIAEASLWSEAADGAPRADVLQRSVAHLNESIALAEDSARQLRRLAPANAEFLQAYGTFLAQVRRDTKGAMTCFREAEQVEDEQAATAAANTAAAAAATAAITANSHARAISEDPSLAGGVPAPWAGMRGTSASRVSVVDDPTELAGPGPHSSAPSSAGPRPPSSASSGGPRPHASAPSSAASSSSVSSNGPSGPSGGGGGGGSGSLPPTAPVIAPRSLRSRMIVAGHKALPSARGLRSVLVASTRRAQANAASAEAEAATARLAAAAAAAPVSPGTGFSLRRGASPFSRVSAAAAAIAREKHEAQHSPKQAPDPSVIKSLTVAIKKSSVPSLTKAIKAAEAATAAEAAKVAAAKEANLEAHEATAALAQGATERAMMRASSFRSERSEQGLEPSPVASRRDSQTTGQNAAAAARSQSAHILARAAQEVAINTAVADLGGDAATEEEDEDQQESVADAPLTIKARASARETFYLPMRMAFRVSFTMSVVVFIAGVIAQQIQSTALGLALIDVQLSSDRAMLAERMTRRVSQMSLLAGGLLSPETSPVPLNFTDIAAGLQPDSELLTAAHRTLYASASAAGLPEELTLYTEPFLTFALQPASSATGSSGVVEPPSASSATTLKVGLADGTTNFVARASSVSQIFAHATAATNFKNFTLALPDVYFIVSNGPGPLRLGLNTATALVLRRAQVTIAAFEWTVYASFGANLLVVAAALVFFIVPELISTLVRFEAVGAALVAMPQADLKALFDAVLRHFLLLRRTAGGDSSFRALLTQYGPPGAEVTVSTWLANHARSLLRVNLTRAFTNVKKSLLMKKLRTGAATPMDQLSALVKSSAITAREIRENETGETREFHHGKHNFLHVLYVRALAAFARCRGTGALARHNQHLHATRHRTHIRHVCLRRMQMVFRVAWPFAALVAYVAGLFGFSLGVVQQVQATTSLALAFAAMRGVMPAPAVAARTAATEGLAFSTWRQPLGAPNRPATAPACNETARLLAHADVLAAARGLDVCLTYAVSGGVWTADAASAWPAASWPAFTPADNVVPPLLPEALGSNSLLDLLYSDMCGFVSAGSAGTAAPDSTAGGDGSSGNVQLSLPPLDCLGLASGLLPGPGTVTTGSYNGLGLGGLVGALLDSGLRAAGVLPALPSAAANTSAIAAAAAAVGDSGALGAFPCAPPALDFPTAAWNLDAATWLLLDPAARAALALVLENLQQQLVLCLTVQALLALFLPIYAALLYGFALAPLLKDLDAQAKMGRAVFLLLPRRLLTQRSVGRDSLLSALREQSSMRALLS